VRLKLDLDPDTAAALVRSALAERRPADWQAETLIRRALQSPPLDPVTGRPHEGTGADDAGAGTACPSPSPVQRL
jgi:hypothetical protein